MHDKRLEVQPYGVQPAYGQIPSGTGASAPTVARALDGVLAPHTPRGAPRARLWIIRIAVTGARAASIALPVMAFQLISSGVVHLTALLVALVTVRLFLRIAYSPRVLPRGVGNLCKSVIGVGSACLFLLVMNVEFTDQIALFALAGAALVVVPLSALVEHLASRTPVERERVLVVGPRGEGFELAFDLATERTRFDFAGLLPESKVFVTRSGGRTSLRAGAKERILSTRPDVIVLAGDEAHFHLFDSLFDSDVAATLTFMRISDFYEYAFSRIPVSLVSPHWFVSALSHSRPKYTRIAKRAFDVCVALTLLVITSPIIVTIIVSMKTLSPGPLFFRQDRVGENGRLFEILKFRTMRTDAEQQGAAWAVTDDTRVTSVGRVLRRTHLDEIPQLLNVLRNEMSIVGPRPERPEFMELLEAEIPYWSRRLLMKPGVTGWAQVHHGYTSDATGTATKLSFDLWYFKYRSMLLDAAILAMTLKVAILGTGAR